MSRQIWQPTARQDVDRFVASHRSLSLATRVILVIYKTKIKTSAAEKRNYSIDSNNDKVWILFANKIVQE